MKIKIFGSGFLFQTFYPLAPMDAQQGSKLSGLYAGGDLSTFIQKLFVFAITIGAIIAVVQLMRAGYLYMGSEIWSSKSKAREIFVNVIFGLLLLLSIWLILQKINPQILNLDILKVIKGQPAQGLVAPAGQKGVTPQAGCSYTDPDTGVCLVVPGSAY